MSSVLSFPPFDKKKEQSGKTPVGDQAWSMRVSFYSDTDDSSVTHWFTLGPLSFYHSDDQGRDSASTTDSVSYSQNPGESVSVSIREEQNRVGSYETKKNFDKKKEVVEGINAVAAKEGLTGQQLAKVLPRYFSSLVAELAC